MRALSPKARAIMRAIMQGYRDPETGEQKWYNIRDLINVLPYKARRDSLYFSLRALEKRGYVERGLPEQKKSNGRWIVPLMPSHKALDELTPGQGKPRIYEDEEGDIIEYFD